MGTLVLSDQDILSQNETMMFIDAEGGSEDEMEDDLLPLEEDTTEQPSSKSFFLTEDSQNNSSSNLRILPDLESVEPQFGNSKSNAKHKSSGLLETHFTTDESKLGDAKAASAATELSANLRANYPPPPKIVCTDVTAAPAKKSKKADAKETQSKSKKASAASDDKINDSLNETLNTQQTPTTSSQASLDSKSSGKDLF